MIESVTQEEHGWLKGMIGALIILNMLDGVMTIGWIEFGRAVEINPLMDVLLSTHPVLFMSIKLILVYLGATLLWRYRMHKVAMVSICLCCLAYTCIFFYHLGGGFIA